MKSKHVELQKLLVGLNQSIYERQQNQEVLDSSPDIKQHIRVARDNRIKSLNSPMKNYQVLAAERPCKQNIKQIHGRQIKTNSFCNIKKNLGKDQGAQFNEAVKLYTLTNQQRQTVLGVR